MFGAEDYELILRLAARGEFAFIEEPLALYRKHPGTISADPDRMARICAGDAKGAGKAPSPPAAEQALLPPAARDPVLPGLQQLRPRRVRRSSKALPRAVPRVWADPVSLAVWGACLLPAGAVVRPRRVKRSVAGGKP